MTDKEYIGKLEALAFQFRDEPQLCKQGCSACALFPRYCDVLGEIYNIATEKEEKERA